MRVLLTDGGSKNTLAIIRYLGKEGVVVDILHHKKSSPSFSKYCNHLYISPNINEKQRYYSFVLEIVEKENYDLLIPVGAKAVKLIGHHLAEIQKFTNVYVPPATKIDLALNKGESYEFVEKLGIRIPKTYHFFSRKQFENTEKEIFNFPLIIKSSNESIAKFETVYINNYSELVNELTTLERKFGEVVELDFPLIQEQIVGTGYGFFALYDQGNCKTVFMHQRLREFPPEGGASSMAKSIYDKNLLEAGKKILDSLAWHGPAMVEFKKDHKSDEYVFIELNPKLWGSLELCLKSGQNIVKDLCRMAQNENLNYNDRYTIDLKFQWLFSYGGEFYRLKRKKSDIVKVLTDMMNPKVANEISLRDIKPNIKDILDYLSNLK